LNHYPLLQDAIDNSRNISGIGSSYNPAFNALVEFTNGESVLRGFNFSECRVSDAQITTQTDKEEGFTGKSGFVIVHQLGFTCSGISPVNMHFDGLTSDVPFWKTTYVTNTFEEPLQNTDKNMSVFTTFTFDSGMETIEFSMFKQNEMLTATEDIFISSSHIDSNDNFDRKTTYPTLELRGIVGDYPILYDYVDDNRKVQGVSGASQRELIDIDVNLVYDDEVIRGFNYSNCRPVDYTVETDPDHEESYVKNKFALENIFDFECSGYTSNNPVYDAMFNVEKANTPSTFDLRNTDKWGPGFSVQK